MSTIDSIVAASATPIPPTATTTANTSKQKLDGQMFLQLLVTQLRAQDPSSPMDTNAMMTQTAQLSSMEQLTSLTSVTNDQFSLQMRMAASGMVGKQVSYVDADGVTKSGVASSVSFTNAMPMVTIGSTSVRLDAISGVTSAS